MAKAPAKNVDHPSTRPTGWKVEDYDRVVELAELVSVRLLQSKFEVKPLFFDEGSHRLASGVRNTANVYIEDTGSGHAFVTVEVEVFRARSKVLSCSANYVASYRGLEGSEEKAVQAFLARVGTFAVYPYFRSLFASFDWAAGTDLPPLPVHREAKVRKPKQIEG